MQADEVTYPLHIILRRLERGLLDGSLHTGLYQGSACRNGKAVLGRESKFAAAVRAGTATPRVLITMGSEEQTPDPKYAARFGLDFEQQAAQIRRHRMVDNARELTERLKALRGSGAFEVEAYTVFPKQRHNIAAWSGLAHAVSFAFPR